MSKKTARSRRTGETWLRLVVAKVSNGWMLVSLILSLVPPLSCLIKPLKEILLKTVFS